MAQPPRYAYDIPSITSVHPHPILNTYPEFTSSIKANALMDRANVAKAEWTVGIISSLLKEKTTGITGDMLVTAQLRHAALQNIHASAEFGGGDVATTLGLINQQLATIDNRLAAMNGQLTTIDGRLAAIENSQAEAEEYQHYEFENMRSRMINGKKFHGNNALLYKMKKTVSGQGTNLAIALCPNAHHWHPNNLLNDPALGAQAVYELNAIKQLSDSDILDLIQFYNDSFGILAEDDIQRRQDKFTLWHM